MEINHPKQHRQSYKSLMPMRVLEVITDEYDRLAKEAVISAVKEICDKTITIDNIDDFTNALNDLRTAGYLIKFVMQSEIDETESKDDWKQYKTTGHLIGEFKLFKIDGGMVM